MVLMLPFASDFLLIVSLSDFMLVTLKNINLMLVDLEFDSF